MPLQDCIKRAGKSLDRQDAQALHNAVAEGLSEEEAIERVLGSLNTELQSVVDRVEEAGGTVVMEEIVAPVEPEILAQLEEPEAIRASIQFTDDQESIIRLTKASDLSSFLHESAHLFLETEKRFAEKFGETENMQILFEWLGVKSFDEITVEHHEKFAETFEVYAREGKAPSLKLRNAFAAFRRWLTRIYQSLGLRDPRLARADLAPEIVEYMDRMLATSAEIEEATANPAYDQYFRSQEQAGMSDAEWAAYQAQDQKAKDTALMDLDQKVIEEYHKRKTQEWAEERLPMIDEEVERLRETPVYEIIEVAQLEPMDRKQFKSIGNLRSIPPNLRNTTTMDGTGHDPDVYADTYGFDSVTEMIEMLVAAPTIRKAAYEAAEARMIEKYGDMLNDGRIELEAREAIHNEEQAKLLLQELKALNRKTGALAPKINRTYLKAEAKRLIGTMTYRDIKPNKYHRAEIKAAQGMAVAKTDEARLTAQIQRIINHYMYKEAVETKARMGRHRKQVRGYEVRQYPPKTVSAPYAQNIRMLAKSYNMRQGDAAKSLNVKQVVDWMITQLNDPNNYIDLTIYDPAIVQMIVDHQEGRPVTYELPAFDDLTADELRGLTDQLRHMRYVGGRLSDEVKAELLLTRQTAAESINEHAQKTILPEHEKQRLQDSKDAILEFGYSHRRIGGILETLDGFHEDGLMSVEYDRINDASNKELELTDTTAQSTDKAFKGVLRLINRRKKATVRKQDGVNFTLTHRARFVLGLNWGNESNREAVLEGLNNKFPDTYTEADIVAMLSTMSDIELNALNKVWATKEVLWPEMSAVEVRRKGVAPRKIEASSFTINDIKLTGGHYRLHYRKDPDDTTRKEISVDRSSSTVIKIGTASSMNERVGSGGRQVDLELSHLFQDMQEEIHYIAFAELSDHLNAMFKGVKNPVVSSIMTGYGEPYYDNVVETLGTLTQPEDPVKGLWKGLKFVRSNLTYAFLAGSIRNVLLQPIAITNTISQLGERYTLQGVFEFYRNPVKNWDMIRKADPFMRNRTALVNREAREQLLKIDAIHPALGAMKNLAFLPQTFMDSLIAFPTWLGAKAKYKAEHPDASEKKAIAYAGEMVKKTIGSGLAKDVGSILNKGEAENQITFMGTFFNLTWNLHVENAQLLKRDMINPMEYARRLGWMAMAPALIAMWLLDDVPEDDEELIPHALKEIAYYNMSSLFLVRDLASKMDGFNPSIPGLKFADGIVRVGDEMRGLIVGDEEFDAETVASIIRGVQPLIPIPGSGQIARTLEGLSDPKQDIYGALVEGKERN